MENDKRISRIEEKIALLEESARQFQSQIYELKKEFSVIQNIEKANPVFVEENKPENYLQEVIETEKTDLLIFKPETEIAEKSTKTSNLEDFIGGNVVSKLGILILIVGLGFFVNYAIENNWITPLGRILLAYLAGLVLLGFAAYLKKSYRAYSAVLLSGGLATIYFTSFIAYSFLSLMPQTLAFALMFLTTFYTVYQASLYDEEIIGIIGLVGAYSVPVLLNDGSGRVLILFLYMGIVNAGVLVLAFRKNWQMMNRVAFIATWLIFISWFGSSFQVVHFYTALVFCFVFFGIFYTAFLTNQIHEKRTNNPDNNSFIFGNNVLFFLLGAAIINYQYTFFEFIDQYIDRKYDLPITQLSLFTLFNTLIHSLVSIYLIRENRSKVLAGMVMSFALVFLSLSIFIFFKDEWIVAFWLLEAGILFYFAKNREIILFEKASRYLVILITGIIPFTFEQKWITPLWLTEALLLFFVARSQKSPAFENLSYLVSILGATQIVLYYSPLWTSILWTLEALVLFALARSQKSLRFEQISYLLMCVTILHLWQFWKDSYVIQDFKEHLPAISNYTFLSLLIFSLALAGILGLHFSFPVAEIKPENHGEAIFAHIQLYLDKYLIVLLIAAIYCMFFGEIYAYQSYLYFKSIPKDTDKFVAFGLNFHNESILHFRNVLLLVYSAVYLNLFVLLCLFIPRHKFYFYLNLGFTFVYMFLFSVMGFFALSRLTFAHLNPEYPFLTADSYLNIRFWAYLTTTSLLAGIFYFIYQRALSKEKPVKYFIVSANLFILTILSFELMQLLIINYSDTTESIEDAIRLATKTGFTLLWSLYSLGLVAVGIWKKRRFLRLTGFAIFGITLAKLFFRDLDYSSTLQMIFAFIGVGVLLLVTAFLYQKYKAIILAEDE